MIALKKSLLGGCLLLVIHLSLASGSSGSQASLLTACDAGRIRWFELAFGAKNFLASVNVSVRLESFPEAEARESLLVSPTGVPVQSSSPLVYSLLLGKSVDPIFRPIVKSSNRVWFDPQQGAVLGRIRYRRGKDDYQKKYRFTAQGVFRHRREPKNKKEATLAPGQWTDTKDTFYPYDPGQLGCAYITERSALIYLVSAAALTPDAEPQSLCVFGLRQLHRVSLRVQGTHSLKVNYIEKNHQTETRRKGTVEALKIAIEARPMESGLSDSEEFSILGLHKDIVFFIDAGSRLPLQISGHIPGIGRADLKLDEVRIRQGGGEKSQAGEDSEIAKERFD